MGLRPSTAVVCAALVASAACRYDFQNPAEALRAGEVRGHVLADAGAGARPNAGVSVTLKNSDLTQLSRDTGLFVVVPLPPGRHTLLFRKGTTWAVEREVEVPLGRDGQPEGVALGDVVLRYSSAVSGRVDPPAGWPGGAPGGVVVDLTAGLTAPVVDGTFSFPVLSTGPHRLAVAVKDFLGGQWVGGPVDLDVPEDAQQQAVRLAPLPIRPASGQGRLTFQVQNVGGALDPTLVAVTGVPGVTAPGADGRVEVTLPEGRYAISLAAPAAALTAAGGAPVASLARPALEAPAGAVEVVVLRDEVADVGPIYLVEAAALSEAALACAGDADCACYTPACQTDGACGVAGLCVGWSPPQAVPATTPFCSFDRELNYCSGAGDCLSPAEYCAIAPGDSSGSCLACGASCTFDGLTASRPAASECGGATFPVSGAVTATYWAEDGSTESGPGRFASQTAVSVVPAGATAALPGTFDPATGAFSVPGVTPGTFLLVVDARPAGGVYQAFETSAFNVSVTELIAGRRGRVLAANSTPVTFDTTTLVPWTANDLFTVASAGAGLNVDRFAPLLTGTSGPVLIDFQGLPLVDAAAGDLAYAAQLVSTSFSGAPSGTTVFDAQGVANLAFTLADGSPSAIPTALGSRASAGFLSHDLDEAAWQAVGADLTLGGASALEVRVHAIPHTLSFPAPTGVDPTMWVARVPAGAGAFLLTADYGRFLGPSYQELVEVRYLFTAGFNAPGASPAVTELSAGSDYPAAAVPPAPAPALGLPHALTVNGIPGTGRVTGVGTTPLLGWAAPALGTPSRYEVELVRLANVAGFTELQKLASFRLGPSTRSLRIPAGLLAAGEDYVAFVTAAQSPNAVGGGATVLLGGDYPLHHATNVTATFSPSP